MQLAWELILAWLCDAGDGSFQSAARLLELGTAAARQVGDTAVELMAWASLATVELATGNLRRTATIGASFAGTDARTGLVEHAVTGLTHVSGAMTDPARSPRPCWTWPTGRCYASPATTSATASPPQHCCSGRATSADRRARSKTR